MKTSTSSSARPLRDEISSMWAWVKQHRLLVGSAAVVVLGLALGWNWLAAAGALPFLFFLPCALMMGMCMKGMGSNNAGKSDSQNSQAAQSRAPAALPEPSSQQIEEKAHV
jgi:hypothetical protein